MSSDSKTLDCVELTRTLITYPSVTPNECGIYKVIMHAFSHLPFECITQERNGTKNLFLHTKDSQTNDSSPVGKPHICFAGHIDVVPAGEGWSENPFGGEVKNGRIFGRGSQDMKSGVSAFVCALKAFVEENPKIIESCKISILLTSDEEGDGEFGTRYMLKHLENLNLLPTMAIVAEPTCEKVCGDTIKIGRRGSVNGKITIFGKQGHAAYPQHCINPTELLGVRLGDLAGVDLDNGDESFEPSKLVITDIRGGMEVVNVTPDKLTIMFNVRNSPATKVEHIESYIKKVLDGLDFELSIKQTSQGFITQRDNALVALMQESIQAVCGITPALSTSGGTSDARFFGARGIPVVEIGVTNDRIHAIDECVPIEQIRQLQSIFARFLINLKHR
ncbi:succinyl-diaminopimelate desuccinylase [Helicobacter sp. 23-1048]